MSILVLGSSGQLATHLREMLPEATFYGRDRLDLAQPECVRPAVMEIRPSVIVNAAGYTAVDKAESEPALAWRVNAESTAAIALAAEALDVPVIHVSTDYVFDGLKEAAYSEDDAANPLSVYGASKLAGELAIRTLCKKAWILRVSWVFSEYGANFLKTILRLAATRDEISVVADQFGRPTYAGDLALVVAALTRVGHDSALPFGIYNAVGGPAVTWCEFAREIVTRALEAGLLERAVPVRAIMTAEYPTAARRPANSVLKPNETLNRTLGVSIDWQKGLATALATLGKH